MTAARAKCASCGKTSDALKHCKRCMNISYCSKSCQEADWPRHKTTCDSQSPQNKPEPSKPDDETTDQRHKCSSCGKASESLKQCVRCRKVSYCDRNCQQNDWPRHKSTCGDTIAIRDRCAFCGTTSHKLKKCTGCRRVFYCDRNCQAAHRSTHKAACGTQST